MDANLIHAWIEYHVTNNRSLFWAWEELDRLVRVEPELSWKLIQDIALESDEPIVLANLAAGPLEDLLLHHGKQFIDRIEIYTRQNPHFVPVVMSVWSNAIEKEVWDRFHAMQLRYHQAGHRPL